MKKLLYSYAVLCLCIANCLYADTTPKERVSNAVADYKKSHDIQIKAGNLGIYYLSAKGGPLIVKGYWNLPAVQSEQTLKAADNIEGKATLKDADKNGVLPVRVEISDKTSDSKSICDTGITPTRELLVAGVVDTNTGERYIVLDYPGK